ncbi:hypothetical protein ACFL02_08430, partial [Planctomycetota bacterium]
KCINITSRAADPKRSKEIQEILNTVFGANGGTTYFQQLGLVGSIYGFVDVVLRWNEHFMIEERVGGNGRADSAVTQPRSFNEVRERTKQIILEVIESPRSLPILNENDYRKIDYYIQHYWQQHNELSDAETLVKTVNHWGRHAGRQKETLPAPYSPQSTPPGKR